MASEPDPAELIAQAERHLRERRFAEAIEVFGRALAIRPELSDAWFNLGFAQRAARRFDAALESYANAIRHNVARPEEARLNRAAIFSDHLFRSELAIAELEAALGDNARFVPAWLGLGAIYEDLGDADAARHAYRQALEVDSGNGRARARLGMIDVAAGDASRASADLKQALAQELSAEDRAEILFALGSALDAAQEYDDAFQAFEAANWLAGSIAPTRYDRRSQEQFVDALITAYSVPADGAAALKDEHAAPIFICGMFRSGSTLAEQILGRHSAVTAGGEREIIPALAQLLTPYPEAVAALSPGQAAELRANYLDELSGRGLVTDKRCDNFLHIGLIKTLFPEARIVHTLRQPLDNLLSLYFLHFGDAVTYGHDLGDAAHFYGQYRRLMAHWQRLYPGDILDLDYDRLVVDPRAEVGRLLAFLKLPWEENCLNAAVSTDAVRTASTWQVRKPLHDRSSGRWRHYARHLGEIATLV